MDLRRLRYFCAVAEELHFGRAARRMHVVQSAVSQQVKLLEQELGMTLLQRSRQGAQLTIEGAAFLPEALAILARVEAAIQRVKASTEGGLGRLSIAFVDNVLWSALPPILREFRERRPQTELVLRSLDRKAQVDALHRGTVDIGLLPAPPPGDGIESCLLIGDALQLALPKGHPLARRGQVRLGDLAADSFVLFPAAMGSRLLEVILSACASAGFVPRVAQEAEQLHTLLALVSAGLGVTLVPSWVAKSHSLDIAYARLEDAIPTYELLLAWRSDNMNPAIAGFREVVQHQHRWSRADRP